MEHHKLKVLKTAHYYTIGQPTEGVKYFWFVTHGYGQLASRIIRKFEIFEGNDAHFIVAPEALNRFYWKFQTNEVGASWMTKNDRLDEIEDYSNFLTTVFEQFTAQLPQDVKIILFGFSQGCATQLRWILRGCPKFDNLILWGGTLPEDLDYQPFENYFSNKKLHFIVGNTDEFINQKAIDWHLDFAKLQKLNMDYTLFEGKHEVLTDILEDLFRKEIERKGW
jgi:predicted esterase